MISVIIPSYNRAQFIVRALDCIKEQTFTDIELIVVDDGSQDNTKEIIFGVKKNYPFTIKYHYQTNQGAGKARATGVNLAQGEYLAFFDSDDLWDKRYLEIMYHHITFSKLDWVYCAVSRHNLSPETIINENSFLDQGNPRKFLQMKTVFKNGLHIISDPNASIVQIEHGLYLGFQNSIFRKTVFTICQIPDVRIIEDRLFTLLLLKNNLKGGYIKDVLVHCYEHSSNTSAVGDSSIKRLKYVFLTIISGYKKFPDYVSLTRTERSAINKKISELYFWSLGYNLMFKNGNNFGAIKYYLLALKHTPTDLKKWRRLLFTLCCAILPFKKLGND